MPAWTTPQSTVQGFVTHYKRIAPAEGVAGAMQSLSAARSVAEKDWQLSEDQVTSLLAIYQKVEDALAALPPLALKPYPKRTPREVEAGRQALLKYLRKLEASRPLTGDQELWLRPRRS